MSSVYSEVTATYSRDRVLEKFDTAANTLPYTLNDIKISHNDLLVANVYNNSISKLYSNYLYLIANAEITTKVSPTTALSSLNFNDTYVGTLGAPTTTTTGTTSLSTIKEVHVINKRNYSNNSQDRLVLSFGDDNSLVFKYTNDGSSVVSLISGNKVEFNKQFEYSEVVAVDSIDNNLFVLDKGNNTLFKYDASGLINSDPPVERTGITSGLPGRFLVKTIGGKGKVNRKNKLTDPSGISIFDNKIYVLDNGNLTIKVFDLNFNFINSHTNKEIFDYKPVSISVSRRSDLSSVGKIFILGQRGEIITCNLDFTNLKVYKVFADYTSRLDASKFYSEKTGFKKIISSPSNNNVLYVVTNKSVVKFYKTNPSRPISFYDTNRLGLNQSYEFINSMGVESISGVDNLVLCSHLSSGETKYSIFKDENNTTKLYHDNFYTNYFSLSDIAIKPQELVNSITFNKTTEKLSYNNLALYENLNKKIYSYYTSNRVPEISTVVESTFTAPSGLDTNPDFYIGVNEPILTDIINRPLTKLYEQQTILFDSLKESFLNTNPPDGVSEILVSEKNISTLPVIRFDTLGTNLTVGSPGAAEYTVTRTKTDVETSFKVYTSPVDTNTLTSDYVHIPETDPLTITFDYGVASVPVSIGTDNEAGTVFRGKQNKQFTTFLTDPSGGVLDQLNSSRVTTITGAGDTHVLNLSSDDSTLIEGYTKRFAVTRTSTPVSTLSEPISVNIYTSNLTTSDNDFTTIPYYTTYGGTLSTDYSDFSGSNYGEVSAVTLSAGTVVFQPYISAVFFDLSAASGDDAELQESFLLQIHNPSPGSILGADYEKINLLKEDLIPISLTVDSTYPTNVNSTGKLSGVNIWSLLCSNTTFQQNSSNRVFDVSLTLNNSLTVYSPSADRGAIYFDSGSVSNPLQPGNELTITVNSNNWVVGKGGDGGTGMMWLSGFNFLTGLVSTTNDLDDEDSNFVEHAGQDGGPAITVDDFTYLSINNSGYIYGGAGGGGAGFLPVTADPAFQICVLSATSGGGGGAGILPNGVGCGGPGHPGGTFGSVVATSATFVTAGGDGTETSGGSGGDTYNYETDSYFVGSYSTLNLTVMDGGSGGGLGLPGQGSDIPDDCSNYCTCFYPISSDVKRFEGGGAGPVVGGAVHWYTKTTDITSGTFSGSDI